METNTKNDYDTTFKSWMAFVDYVQKMKWFGGNPYDAMWAGGTKEDAFRLANFGWPEQTHKVSLLARKVADRMVEHSAIAETTKIVFDVCGAAYDPGSYLSGMPECWIAFKQEPDKAAVRIVVDGTVSAGVNQNAKIALGTAVSALILSLNGAGHPTTVDLFFGGASYHNSGETSCFIRINDAELGSILDIDRVTYAIAHPLPMRGMAHTLWHGHSVYPFQRNDTCKDTKGKYDLWLGGGFLTDVAQWKDNGEQWVFDQYLKQTKDR